MGDTGIGKTVGIELLSKLMDVMFKIVKVSAGTSVDEIIEAVTFTQKSQREQKNRWVIFFDEINTN